MSHISAEDKVRVYYTQPLLSASYLSKYECTPIQLLKICFAKIKARFLSHAETDDSCSQLSNSVDTRYMKSRPGAVVEEKSIKQTLSTVLTLCALMRRILLKRKRAVTPQSAHMKEANSDAFGVGAKTADGMDVHIAQDLYERQKKILVSEEIEESWDYNARKTASKGELRAQDVMLAIREDERTGLFGNIASEAIPLETTRDMGGQFLTNKDRIAESRIYAMAREMPKGMHLHLHFNAELQPDILIERAKDNDCMFIRSTQPLVHENDYDETEMVFSVLPLTTKPVDIFSPDYNPEFRKPGSKPWMRWSSFRDEFFKRRGTVAEEWIKTKLILSENEVYAVTQTTNG
jgi:hypothetical protein